MLKRTAPRGSGKTGFHSTFSGETGWRGGGGGQGSARSGLSGPGRGSGDSGGGGGVEVRGVSGVAHLVFGLQRQTSGQQGLAHEKNRAARVETHLVWAAVVHPVLPVTVEAAGASAKMKDAGSKAFSIQRERAAQAA